MIGGYVWALVAIGILVVGAVMAFAMARYTRTHKQRSPAEKRISEAVTKENYRDPVAHDG